VAQKQGELHGYRRSRRPPASYSPNASAQHCRGLRIYRPCRRGLYTGPRPLFGLLAQAPCPNPYPISLAIPLACILRLPLRESIA